MTKKPKKTAAKKSNKAKKKTRFLSKHPLLVPVTIFFVLVFFGLGMFVAVGATTGTAKDTHIVDLYDNGMQRTLTTRADTVEDLLNRLEINLLDEDIVEPARETPILEQNTQINIYRARPVEVIDGSRVLTVLSAEQVPSAIVKKAGITLQPEDEINVVRREGNSSDIGLGEQFVIDRSLPIQLNVYGLIEPIRTTADTVGELFTERNIVLNEGETQQPSDPNTPITAGMFISVNKPGIQTVAQREPIAFETEIVTDRNVESGTRQVRSAGVDGEQAIVYEVTEQDGQEVSRRVLQTVVVRAPQNEIVVVGTKLATLDSSVSISGDKTSIMAAAGLAPSDYVYADFIIQKESRWRPGAQNAGSGAYGLCQALPASKMSSAGADYLTNPVTQMQWCNGYAQGRYGGWQGAYNAWLAQGWW